MTTTTDTAIQWADLGPRDRRRIRGAVADLAASRRLDEAADLLDLQFAGDETIADHAERMRRESAELVENAHDSMTPDEFEAYTEAHG